MGYNDIGASLGTVPTSIFWVSKTLISPHNPANVSWDKSLTYTQHHWYCERVFQTDHQKWVQIRQFCTISDFKGRDDAKLPVKVMLGSWKGLARAVSKHGLCLPEALLKWDCHLSVSVASGCSMKALLKARFLRYTCFLTVLWEGLVGSRWHWWHGLVAAACCKGCPCTEKVCWRKLYLCCLARFCVLTKLPVVS